MKIVEMRIQDWQGLVFAVHDDAQSVAGLYGPDATVYTCSGPAPAVGDPLPAGLTEATEPRVLSRRAIYEQLNALGLWEAAKPLIEAEAGEYWVLSHDVREDHPKFAALLAQLRPQLEAAGVNLDALLNECIMERY